MTATTRTVVIIQTLTGNMLPDREPTRDEVDLYDDMLKEAFGPDVEVHHDVQWNAEGYTASPYVAIGDLTDDDAWQVVRDVWTPWIEAVEAEAIADLLAAS